ncbi:MAG: choice-of-anchor J domain-containing protein [Lentimicrobiaceae bacterium]|nr:choice-of-anchor J domain-containing protein [Lentimicrobiaceae bacterium]
MKKIVQLMGGIALFALYSSLSINLLQAQSAVVTARPAQIDISAVTSESAVLMTLSGYSQDDARYRLYSGGNQYNCWDEANDEFVTSNSYANNPPVPGTPTTSTTFWILFQRGSNASTAASYRDRLGPAYSGNYQTAALPAAAEIAAPVIIQKSNVSFGTWTDFSVRYVVLGYDAPSGGTLIAAAPTALTTGDFNLIIETGTILNRIEVRDVMNNLIESVAGTWPSGISVLPPTGFSATAQSNTQINLGWTLNAANNGVLLAWSADGIFGTPTGTYTPGGTIAGGGNVIYTGTGNSFNHTALTPETEYFYKIWSYDGSEYSPGITTSEETYPDPTTTTLPYVQDFSGGFGDCGTFSVSGDTKQWLHSASGGYVYMNGYNSGELEEDWLILPGMNLDNYFNESLSFDTWYRFGNDDADNYFRFVYSTNYSGMGSPADATWTEISFTRPAVEQEWVSSGVIDIAGITGTNVYFAFKYYYNAGNYRSWQVDNINVNAGNAPALLATPTTLNGFTYEIGNGPSASQSYTLTGQNLQGSGNITATAPADYELSLNGTTWNTVVNLPYAGGQLTGQPVSVYVRLKAGLAIGTYNNQTILHNGGGVTDMQVTLNGNVTELLPVISSEMIPEYIQGTSPSNNQRLPYAFHVSISNLMPSATYRYYNKVVLSTDSPTSNGAGNTIFVNADGTFTRTSSTSFGNAGEYGEFVADANGNYSGWFITEPSGNTRFTVGNEVYMRIMLNNGADGTAVVNRLTTSTSAEVINFGDFNEAGMGTGIRGVSEAISGNMVYLYDNEDGNGRPVYGTSIETTGVDFIGAGSYATFYKNDVQGINGSWGGLIPNVLPDGIRRVEERSRITGEVVSVHTSPDGVWGAYDTRNPFGGEVDIIVLDLLAPGNPLLTVSPATLSGFTYVEGNGPSEIQTYTLSGTDLQGSDNVTVTAPEAYEVSANGTDFVGTITFPIVAGEIAGQPVTVSVRLSAGLEAGDYSGQTIINSGGGAADKMVTLNGTVTSAMTAVIEEVTLPMYMEGLNGGNNNRVPFAFRASLKNLSPETTYRYYNKVVVESDLPDYNGAGNPIFVNEIGEFTRATTTSFNNPGEYGTFTTDTQGSYTGWFITEPTGNDRFAPGNQVYMRISLNDGNEGTTVVTRLTTDDFATILQFGTEAIDTHGTAIRGVSQDNAKDFIYLYDNVEGNGRPLYGTHIEASEVDFSSLTSYAPFYLTEVAGINGSWGGIVPNINNEGVKRVEVRSLTDGSIMNDYNVPSAIWIGVNTINPNGGVDNVLVLDLINIGIDYNTLGDYTLFTNGTQLNLRVPGSEKFTLSLYNLQGQRVFVKQFAGDNTYTFNLNVPAGIYVASIRNASGAASQKLFISK